MKRSCVHDRDAHAAALDPVNAGVSMLTPAQRQVGECVRDARVGLGEARRREKGVSLACTISLLLSRCPHLLSLYRYVAADRSPCAALRLYTLYTYRRECRTGTGREERHSRASAVWTRTSRCSARVQRRRGAATPGTNLDSVHCAARVRVPFTPFLHLLQAD